MIYQKNKNEEKMPVSQTFNIHTHPKKCPDGPYSNFSNKSGRSYEVLSDASPAVKKTFDKFLLAIAAFFIAGAFVGSLYGFYAGFAVTLSLVGGSFAYKIYTKTKDTKSDDKLSFNIKPADIKSEVVKSKPIVKKEFPKESTLDIAGYRINRAHFRDEISRPQPPPKILHVSKQDVRDFINHDDHLEFFIPDKDTNYYSSFDTKNQNEIKKRRYLNEKAVEKRNKAMDSLRDHSMNPTCWTYLKHIISTLKQHKKEKGIDESYNTQMYTLIGLITHTNCCDRVYREIEKIYHCVVRNGDNYLDSISFPSLVKRALLDYRLEILSEASSFKGDFHQANTAARYYQMFEEEFGLPKMSTFESRKAMTCGVRDKEHEIRAAFNRKYSKEQVADRLLGLIYPPGWDKQKKKVASKEYEKGNSPSERLNYDKYQQWLEKYFKTKGADQSILFDENCMKLDRKAMVLLLNEIGVFEKK